MTSEEQHHDHIWLTVHGESWAIRRIYKTWSGRLLFHLHRGYEPYLEQTIILVEADRNWEMYADAAVRMMEMSDA